MKLATFTHQTRTRIGLVDTNEIIDLSAADPGLPVEMKSFLSAGPSALERARDALESRCRIELSKVRLEAPIQNPPLCMHGGANYRDHVGEAGLGVPDCISGNIKISTALTGPFDPIVMPRISEELDYELEFSVVIGKSCRGISRQDAPHYIAGYLIVNDGSVRDWHPPKRGRSGAIGKNFDRTSPMGPWIVTPDEIDDPHSLTVRTWVNGELRQNDNTKNMIFDCFDHVEVFSKAMTLLPGSIITTGTPSGVGAFFDPPKFLKIGDVVRMEVDKIGFIENRVVAEI